MLIYHRNTLMGVRNDMLCRLSSFWSEVPMTKCRLLAKTCRLVDRHFENWAITQEESLQQH